MCRQTYINLKFVKKHKKISMIIIKLIKMLSKQRLIVIYLDIRLKVFTILVIPYLPGYVILIKKVRGCLSIFLCVSVSKDVEPLHQFFLHNKN